jgi:HAD superfamily hydrolase (TIGR01549 family)
MKQAANLRTQLSTVTFGGATVFPHDQQGNNDAFPVLGHEPLTDFNASFLRCHYAEVCRQRDRFGLSQGCRDRTAALSAYYFRQLLRALGWAKDTLTGSARTIRSLPDILPLCGNADVVSFDAFDTLLYRTVEPPDYLKLLAANYGAQLYAARGYPITAEVFLYLRNESEGRQRRLNQKQGADTECKLSEIIREVLYRLFGPAEAGAETATLVHYEIDIERQHLRVADGVPELLQRLKSQGKRIIVTTDTYLEQAHLEEIFGQLGIDRWIDAIYASSEQGFGKYSGRLFQKILQTEAIQPERLLHVGDTYESDIRGAVKAGVPAVFLFDVGRRRRLARETAQLGIAKTKSVTVPPKKSVALKTTKPRRNDEPELYRIGREILGPAFTLFVFDVIEESYRIGAADIYYLAREGHLFCQLHETLTQHVHRLRRRASLRHHYLFVSRLATSLPAIRGLSQRELDFAFYRDPSATLAECIGAFGLDPAEFSDLLVDFDNRQEAAKANLFDRPEFIGRVQARADAARSRLRSYLAQEGFFKPQEMKLLVDIGWNATIQANLTQAFHDDPDFPMLLGYYFGRRYRHEDYLVSPRSLYMPGRFFDQKRPLGPEHAIGHCLEIFELAAAAPHGATLNYEETDDGIRPVLSESGADLSDEQRLLQAGILDHAVAFAKSCNDREVDLALLRSQAVEALAQLILRPTFAQTKALLGFAHSLDWGSKKSRPLVAANISPMLVLAPRRFFAALKESYWLEGCMRMSQIPGALMLLSLARRAVRSHEMFLRLCRGCGNYFRSTMASL